MKQKQEFYSFSSQEVSDGYKALSQLMYIVVYLLSHLVAVGQKLGPL